MSTTDNWSTPKDVYRTLDAEFGFDFDPCPLADPPLFDGLKIEWGGGKFRESSVLQNQGLVQESIRGMAEGKNRGHAHTFKNGHKILARLHHEGKRDPFYSWSFEVWGQQEQCTVPERDYCFQG
jgi:hypothetical protein